MKAIILIALFATMNAYACPELDSVDLAGESETRVKSLGYETASLTAEEFKSLQAQGLGLSDYERCKDHMSWEKIKSKATGRIFYALASHEDICDGGNSVGVLYNGRKTKIVGTIGDSFISCK